MTDLSGRVQDLGFGLLETASGFSLLEPTTGTVVRRDMDREALEAWLYRHESWLFDDDPVLEEERQHDEWREQERREVWP